MATIRNLKKQEIALASVTSLLASIKQSRKFLERNTEIKRYELSYREPVPGDYSDTITTCLLCDNKEFFDPLISAYIESLLVELNRLLSEFDIQLSEEELKIIE